MVKILGTITALLILGVVVGSCTKASDSTPVSTAEKMRAQACEGNVEGFISYFDKEAVEGQYKSLFRQAGQNAGGGGEGVDVKVSGGSAPKPDVDTNNLIWEPLSKEVKKKQNSIFCQMELTLEPGKDDVVRLSYAEGRSAKWRFKKDGSTWKVSSLMVIY